MAMAMDADSASNTIASRLRRNHCRNDLPYEILLHQTTLAALPPEALKRLSRSGLGIAESDKAVRAHVFLAQRIAATKTLMTDVKGTANHSVMSKVQAGALADMIKSVNSVLTPAARAHLSCEAVNIEWFCSDHCAAVVAAFDRPGSGKKKERRESQDYLNIHLYGHEHFWRALKSSENLAASKLQLVCNLGMALGLRLPSEHTIKWMTSLWLFNSHGYESLASLPEDAKGVYLTHVKKTWASMKLKSGTPIEWIPTLPSDPLDCCRDFPLTFAAMFPGHLKPLPSQIDVHTVMAFDQSYGCRGGKSKHSVAPAWPDTAAGSRLAASPDAPSGFERMASQMMAQQSRILELVLGTGGGTGSMQPLRSMSSITDLLANRAAASGQSTGQLALTDGTVDSQHSSQIIKNLDSQRDEMTPGKDELTPGKAEAPSPAAPSPAPVTGDIEALLASLAERKKSNATTAAAMKKPAAAADADDADESGGEQTAPAMKRARTEGQVVAKVEVKAKAKGKARMEDPVVAKVETKAKAKGKAATSPVVESEPAGTPPKPKNKAKGTKKVAAAEVAASPPKAKTTAKGTAAVAAVPNDARAKAKATFDKLTDDEKASVSTNRRIGIAAQPWCSGSRECGVKFFCIQRHSRRMAKSCPIWGSWALGIDTAQARAKDAASDIVLGCSKCRWSRCGCAQCKDPSKTMFRWNLSCDAA